MAALERRASRRRLPRAWLALFAIVVCVRLALLVWGRFTPVDGFYLNGALQLARGAAPYEDFTHVAFPFVEWLYAPALALSDSRLAAASIVSGIVVLGTALLLFRILAPHTGGVAAAAAGALYATSAAVLAFPSFERELWTNLLLAAAFAHALRRRTSDCVAGATGGLLAAAMFAKLTAGVGAIAIAVEWLCTRNVRVAAIAAAVAATALAAISLSFFARYEGEFGTQVFAFYAFKGEGGTVATRAIAILKTVDPCVALGLAGALFALVTGRFRAARPFALLLLAWLLHYLFVSPSYWDHNAIDLALPTAALAAFLVRALVTLPRRRVAACACVLALLAGARGLAPERPEWFPHGFGSTIDTAAVEACVARIRDASEHDDLVITGTPMFAMLTNRRPLVSDFELEPIARGALLEIRRFGIPAAFARRNEGILLGVPAAERLEFPSGSLSAQRVFGNALRHLMPRMLDAIARREIAVAQLPGGLPGLAGPLEAARYSLADSDLWVRDVP